MYNGWQNSMPTTKCKQSIPTKHILTYMNLAHILTTYLFKIHFYIIHQYLPGFTSGYLSSHFPTKLLCVFVFSLSYLLLLYLPHLPLFDYTDNVWCKVQIIKSLSQHPVLKHHKFVLFSYGQTKFWINKRTR